MARKLTTWAITADGRTRLLVATDSKREAARLCGVSLHTFNQYAMETGNDAEIGIAQRFPGVVHEKPCTAPCSFPWKVSSVRPYEPRRVAHVEIVQVLEEPGKLASDLRKLMSRDVASLGKPMRGLKMLDLLDTVMADERMAHQSPAAVRLLLRVLDDMNAGVIVPERLIGAGEMIDIANKATAQWGRKDNDLLYLEFGRALLAAVVQPVSKKD